MLPSTLRFRRLLAVLLGAGLDTTANMIALGTLALLQHPSSSPPCATTLASWRGGRGTAAPPEHHAHRHPRRPRRHRHLIRAGESVALAIGAANRDTGRFPNPDTLDLRRRATGPLAFGHSAHQCLGQQLARVEMRVAIPALLRRFPTLRLAVPAEDVPLRDDTDDIYGVRRLPITWE